MNQTSSAKRKAPSTAFKKGYDPRRYVFNKGVTPFREQLSEALNKESMGAVNLLVNTVNDEKAPLKLRIIASKELLDRCLGTSVNQVVVQTLDSSTTKDVTKLSTEELERIVANLAPVKAGDVIEGEIVVNDAGVCSDLDAKNSLKTSGIE